MASSSFQTSEPIRLISDCRILFRGYAPDSPQDIHISEDGRIESIKLHDDETESSNVLHADGKLIAPSLCHAHIHLDKCFLLSDPKFADLEILKGDFAEAMELTATAKARFDREDLVRRGKWLVAESLASGVTHLRAFAEVDHVVGFKCLDAAIELKRLYNNACEIQICAFAQEPVYSGQSGEENRNLMEQAIFRDEVEVLGSTPYVENSEDNMQMNVQWAIYNAMQHEKHLDLHLDYNLDKARAVMTGHVIQRISALRWYLNSNRTISLGHCTRLTLNPTEVWQSLSERIANLPLHFIGLPTSDLFIQGKPSPVSGGGERPRGTLQIPQMIREYGLSACIAINNVGNAFTPYGSCDPLSIASLGVGLYHAGTKDDTQLLYECVSSRAKEAIGYPEQRIEVGKEANFVLFDVGGRENERLSRQRGRKTLQEIVHDPPKERQTVFKGRLVLFE